MRAASQGLPPHILDKGKPAAMPGRKAWADTRAWR